MRRNRRLAGAGSSSPCVPASRSVAVGETAGVRARVALHPRRPGRMSSSLRFQARASTGSSRSRSAPATRSTSSTPVVGVVEGSAATPGTHSAKGSSMTDSMAQSGRPVSPGGAAAGFAGGAAAPAGP